MRFSRKNRIPDVVDSIDDVALRAAHREDLDRTLAQTRAIRAHVSSQWGEVWDRVTYSQQRLEENDLAGALERGAPLINGGRPA